jgi:alkanesulfonate monooxygenase SsuD/methylene tetrahydromethanopterin reductase-like flavin-dependent oxidoreductase (luciferase family)
MLVGGSGEAKTLRLVARYADMCNLFGTPETVAHKIRVLEGHCADLGRDPAEITVSHLTTALVGTNSSEVDDLVAAHRPTNQSSASYAAAVNAGTVADHIGRFREYAEAGAAYSIVNLPDGADGAAVERFGDVIAAFR